MKQLLVIALGFMVNLEASAQPAVKIAQFRYDSISPFGTRRAFYYNPLVVLPPGKLYNSANVLPIAAPPGYYAVGPNSGTQPTDRSLIARNWSNALDATKYFGDTLRPVSGQVVVIDSITAYALSSSQGPTNAQLKTNTTNYMNTVGSILVNNQNAPWKKWKIVPSTVLSSATFIDFRFYAYGTTMLSTTWRLDSVTFYGHLLGVFNLPITLLSFTGEKDGDGVRLDWTTASERDNDYFTILRSKDGWNFEEVTRVPGAGNSTSPIPYWTRDAKPYDGLNYYRLRQTDIDGTQVDHVDKTIMVVFSRTFGTLAHILTITGQETRGSPSELPPGVYIFEDTEGHTQQVLVTSWR